MNKSLALAVALFLPGFGPQADPKRPPGSSSIDSAVARKAPPAEDGEFLRRIMLDLVGYPPDADQVRAFIADAAPSKRAAKIEELLASEDFADLWARMFAEVFFGDYHNVAMDTNPKLSKSASARIVTDFIRWFRMKLQKDRPWTEIVGEILDARGKDEGDPALAYKLACFTPDGVAVEFSTRVARQFLGIRLLCAKCHDQPGHDGLTWTNEHFYGLAAFNARAKARPYGSSSEKDTADHVEFAYVEEGEVEVDPIKIDNDHLRKTQKNGVAKPIFLFGGQAPPGPGVDRMKVLVPLMTAKRNTQLPKALVNRIWGWLMGRGLVHPVDDFREKMKVACGSLLETLTRDAIQNGITIKHIVRTICASQAYQQSSGQEPSAAHGDFSSGTVKQLTGEQLVNSIAVATRGKPDRNPAAVLPMVASLFPAGAVWCEMTPLPGNAREALLLRNNSEIGNWISGGGVLTRIKRLASSTEEKVDEMFLAAVSRRATEPERKRYAAFLDSHPASGFEDAYWTLLNSTEFVTRH